MSVHWDLINETMVAALPELKAKQYVDKIGKYEQKLLSIALQATFFAIAFYRGKQQIHDLLEEKSISLLSEEQYFRERKILVGKKQTSFKIGLIGFGSVAQCILDVMLDSKELGSVHHFALCTRQTSELEIMKSKSKRFYDQPYSKLGITVYDEPSVLIQKCDLVILCILPSQYQLFSKQMEEDTTNSMNVRHTILYSVLAGIPKEKIMKVFKTNLVVTYTEIAFDVRTESIKEDIYSLNTNNTFTLIHEAYEQQNTHIELERNNNNYIIDMNKQQHYHTTNSNNNNLLSTTQQHRKQYHLHHHQPGNQNNNNNYRFDFTSEIIIKRACPVSSHKEETLENMEPLLSMYHVLKQHFTAGVSVIPEEHAIRVTVLGLLNLECSAESIKECSKVLMREEMFTNVKHDSLSFLKYLM
ncbi:hypothetical protein ABK040_002232 [Willaertia magna]